MTIRALRLGAACLLAPCAASHGATAVQVQSATERSVSSTKQFILYGADRTARAKISIGAEDTKRELLAALRIDDEWKSPIILNLGAPAPAGTRKPPKFQLRPLETEGGGMKVQIDVFETAAALDGESLSADLRRLVLNALLLERAYRATRLVAGKPYERPPAWVVEAVDESIRSSKSGLRSGIFARFISGGKPPRLDDFLRQRADRLDPTSLEVYRAQALALLQALLDLPDGPRGLAEFLRCPRRSPTQPAELVACFPSLSGDASSLGRKWILAMARASASRRTELLTVRETAQSLEKTLDGVKAAPDPKTPGASQTSGAAAIPSVARTQGGRYAMQRLGEALLEIEMKAHPVFRPLLEEYRRIATELARRPKKNFDKQLAGAEELRKALSKRVSDIDGYMDWFEASKLSATRSDLDESIGAAADAAEPPHRGDAISAHLDLIEQQGW